MLKAHSTSTAAMAAFGAMNARGTRSAMRIAMSTSHTRMPGRHGICCDGCSTDPTNIAAPIAARSGAAHSSATDVHAGGSVKALSTRPMRSAIRGAWSIHEVRTCCLMGAWRRRIQTKKPKKKIITRSMNTATMSPTGPAMAAAKGTTQKPGLGIADHPRRTARPARSDDFGVSR